MRFSLTTAALWLTVAWGTPQRALSQGFEGVQQFRVSGGEGKALVMVQSRMGSKVRMEMTDLAGDPGLGALAMGAYTLLDLDTREMTMVMPVQQMYLTANLDSLTARLTPPEITGAADTPLRATGRTGSVAGLACEIWSGTVTVQDTTSSVDVCVAKGAGMVTPMGTGGLPGGAGLVDPALQRLLAEGYGVVKVERTVGDVTTTIMELISQEHRALPPGDFLVPEGYRGMDAASVLPPPRARP